MHAGGGVWHSGGPLGVARIKGYQLWIALPPEEGNETMPGGPPRMPGDARRGKRLECGQVC